MLTKINIMRSDDEFKKNENGNDKVISVTSHCHGSKISRSQQQGA